MNLVELTGRLVRDPEEVKTANPQLPIARYTLAVDRRSKEKEADFIEIRAFGESANFALKYFKKGMRVGVEGRLNISTYKNSKGESRTSAVVIVNFQEFLESKKETESKPSELAEGFFEIDSTAEELPFV